MKLAFGRSALPDADQHEASGDEQGRGLVAPAETDWLDHTLAISGPLGMVARFRAAARGTNAAPWSLDLDAEEARLFAPMAREGSAARALARELREVIAANHDRMLARWHEPGGCLFDLHRLVPIPPQVLQLGRDHSRARAWLWENWGTTQLLRHVRLVEEAADRRRRRTRRDVLAFCSADWTPWQAIRRIRREWPDLIFTVEPRYQVTEAGSGGEPGVSNGTALGTASPESPSTPPDPLWDDWETPLRLPPTTPELNLDGFDGPLDLLLDLAERERIDLARLSIGDLVDQFVAAMARYEGRVPLERRADWLVLATRLLVLRSRLFFAASPEVEKAAEAALERERSRLQDLQFIRSAAAWLEARPQIGRDVFVRGRRGRDPRVASYMRLLEACLTVLRKPDNPPALQEPIYRPVASELFQVDAVLRRLRTLVDALEGSVSLSTLLPRLPERTVDKSLLSRSAVAATLIGALELCREGRVILEQRSPFCAIEVAPVEQRESI